MFDLWILGPFGLLLPLDDRYMRHVFVQLVSVIMASWGMV